MASEKSDASAAVRSVEGPAGRKRAVVGAEEGRTEAEGLSLKKGRCAGIKMEISDNAY